MLSRQQSLGWLAAGLLLAAGVLAWNPWGGGHTEHAAYSLVRMGVLVGILWLAWPDLRRLNPWMVGLGMGAGLSLILWPKVFPVLAVLLVAVYFLRPRSA
ncbi:MAG: hypothetical protein SFX18_04335 [Pirellulales bacterium]|nr:hypothetical protein [Pirellulales bacterium]